MMYLIFAFVMLVPIFLLWQIAQAHERRIAALENRKPEQSGKTGHLPDWQKPVENFAPAKPETLRPNAVKGREAGENVFEFDVKVTV